MGWLKNLFGAGVAETASSIGDMVAKVSSGHLGKKELELEIQKILAADRANLHNEVTAELGAKERILIAELQQGDAYTKRARPTVVYAGLAAIFLNHVLAPWISYMLGQEVPEIALPVEFWAAWSAVVMTWSIGRSAEKLGKGNGATRAITGSSPTPTMLS